MDNNSAKSIWNFDQSRMMDLNYRMVLCENAFEIWDLHTISINLHTIRRIVSGALEDTEWDKVKEEFDKLEEIKREMDSSKDSDHEKNTIKYYNKADEIFIQLNRLMQKNGFFFRKGNDPRFAALRR